MSSEAPAIETYRSQDLYHETTGPWLVIVWDDPINLMSYVTWVFQKLFGYPFEVAHKLMMKVHTEGKAVVSSGSKEKAELDVARLHRYGLWATMECSS
jgi:ATP-dependent Clp protease adaptor protein ClpS